MNRKMEYNELISEQSIPEGLEGTLFRAQKRKRKRRRKMAGAGLAAAAALVLAFAAAVNTSPGLAYAMGRVPLLSDLARAVCLGPGQKAALENEYVQPVNISQVSDGFTIQIDYLIVDSKQVNIYYNVSHPGYKHLIADASFADGSTIDTEAGAYINRQYFYMGDAMQAVCIDYVSTDVPETIELSFAVRQPDMEDIPYNSIHDGSICQDMQPTLAYFSIKLDFDSAYTGKELKAAINKWYDLGESRVFIESVEQYKASIRINYRTETTGDVETIQPGIAIGETSGVDAQITRLRRLENPEDDGLYTIMTDYASSSKGHAFILKLAYYTEYYKDMQPRYDMRVDFNSGATSGFTKGAKLLGVEKHGGQTHIQVEYSGRLAAHYDKAQLLNKDWQQPDSRALNSSEAKVNYLQSDTLTEGTRRATYIIDSSYKGGEVIIQLVPDTIRILDEPIEIPVAFE